MEILPEQHHDNYFWISEFYIETFGGHTTEAVRIALHRHRHNFEPELSLRVEYDEYGIAGHALFMLQRVSILGEQVLAVHLASMAIKSDSQNWLGGTAKLLIEEGHRIAILKGCQLSFLLGDEDYFPQFGYKTGVFGTASVKISRHDLPEEVFLEPPLKTGIPIEYWSYELYKLWIDDEAEVGFSLPPVDGAIDWISPNPRIQSTVYGDKDQIVGYSRVHKDEPDKVRVFIARDADIARRMAAMLMGDRPSITLPLHPNSKSAAAFPVKPKVTSWKAAMACSLAPSPFEDYYAEVQAGKRLPGRVIWPTVFDLA